jgi:hypothetical protein
VGRKEVVMALKWDTIQKYGIWDSHAKDGFVCLLLAKFSTGTNARLKHSKK